MEPELYLFYHINTCTKQGAALLIEFFKLSTIIPIPQEIELLDFRLKYRSENEEKFQLIQTSELTLKLLSNSTFNINDVMPEDEREWLIKVSIAGSLKWFGWILPDIAEEPFEGGNYEFTIKAVDGLKSLKNIPFQEATGEKYYGYKTQLNTIREALNKADLDNYNTPIIVFDNTYPVASGVTYDECPMAQCTVNMETYYNPAGDAFSCWDVVQDVLAKGCKLFLHDGAFFIVNIQEYELAIVPSVPNPFKRYLSASNIHDPTFTGYTINSINIECDNIVSGSSNVKKGKASLATTGYYQYSYGTSIIENGNFDQGVVGSLPTGWSNYGGGVGEKTSSEKLLVRQGYNFSNGYVQNTSGIPVQAGNNCNLKFNIGLSDSYSLSNVGKIYIDIVIKSDDGYYYNNGGYWTTTAGSFRVYLAGGGPSTDFPSQSVEFVSIDISSRTVDSLIYVGLVKFEIKGFLGAIHHEDAIYDDVEFSISSSNSNIKKPIGLYTTDVNNGKFTNILDPVMFLHADDSSVYRNGGIKFGATKTDLWVRTGQSLPDAQPIITVCAQNQMRTTGRPYVTFEGDFFGDFITNFDKIILPTYANKFKILEGEFNWITSQYKFMLAECFYEDISFQDNPPREDFGDKKINGKTIQPLGAGTTGSPTVTLNGNDFIKNQTTLQSGANFYVKGGKFDDYMKVPVHAPTDALTAGEAAMWIGALSSIEDDGTTYVLPIASATTLGGIKIGSGLTIDGSGVVSVVAEAPLTFSFPLVRTGDNVTFEQNSSNRLVTDTQIGNWNTAYGWGNHAGLYPTYTGTGATGTWGINITGNAGSATNWGGRSAALVGNFTTTFQYPTGLDAADGIVKLVPQNQFQTWLGLGSAAYQNISGMPSGGDTLQSVVNRGSNADFVLLNKTSNNTVPIYNDDASCQLRIQGDNGSIAGINFHVQNYVSRGLWVGQDGILRYNDGFISDGVIGGNRIIAGFDSGVQGSVNALDWFRSSGNTGWFNQTYEGGIYMIDSTWVRTYGGKGFYCDATILGSTIQAVNALIVPTSAPTLSSGQAAIWIGSLSGITS